MRPQIKDFFEKDVELIVVQEEYTKSSVLYNYMKALDKHIDELEAESNINKMRLYATGKEINNIQLKWLEENTNCFLPYGETEGYWDSIKINLAKWGFRIVKE